ncbi:MAG TPA: enoyl-CoA hydratase/isomerase family protein [Acidimicrobiia bacterium]|nr:enoyl-CoA hydratase/isomerase family protein [Acidimicrobiia bacterium]
MSTDPAVTVELDHHVATVEIHRPPHNWFDIEVITLLADSVLGLDDEPECRALVLCSEGKNFCAGADLSGSDLLDSTGRLYHQAARIFSNGKPIVAAVQGAAVGGGLGLALSADFRVASPETRFSCNFARLGFHQGFGISVTLPAVVGQQRALELMFTAADVRGEEALRIGLADRLVAADQVRGAAHAFATEIAASAPLALLSIRETMRGDLAGRVERATAREEREQQRLRDTEDFREGVAAVAERRPPSFTGR